MKPTENSRENNIAKMVEGELLSWDGVTAAPHRFGGIEFRANNHEIGHLHGDYQADLPFTVRMRQQLVAEGQAELHHLYPKSGWVSYYIHGIEDVAGAITLFCQNYERWLKTPRRQNSLPDKISA